MHLRRPRVVKADAERVLHTLVEVLASFPDTQRRVDGVSVGVNQVTRSLQERIDGVRAGRAAAAPHPCMLFVCVGDTEATAVVAHVPMLVASYNAVCAPTPTAAPPLVLVPFVHGAELVLSTAMHVRRASALLVDTALPSDLVTRLVPSVRAALGDHAYTHGFRAAWLERCVGAEAPRLGAPHIKHVVSGTPVQLAQAKALKKAARKAHKQTKPRAKPAAAPRHSATPP